MNNYLLQFSAIILFWKCALAETTVQYGVDVSYPIHHNLDPRTFQAKRFQNLMTGCYEKYDKPSCDATERARLQMSLDQPRSQHNYTELGFKKLRVPKEAWEPLKKFWDENRHLAKEEVWGRGYTYTNHWDAPTYMVSLEDGGLRGSGSALKQKIWEGVRPILEEWVGRKIIPTSMYGIRMYTDKAILATHVDRLPLVTSCIINVDQDVNEDWPVEVYSHDGKAYNVTMSPGDMVLYESSTVLHGRPAPLNGKFFANIFVHFEPIDHQEMNMKDLGYDPKTAKTADRSFLKNSNNRRISGHEQNNHDEVDIAKYKQDSIDDGQTELHAAAAEGDLDQVKRLVAKNRSLIHAKDVNSWQPLHEAARSGKLEVVQFLVDEGADVAAQTSNGGTALWWAKRLLDTEHSLVRYLEEIGAPEEGEDL